MQYEPPSTLRLWHERLILALLAAIRSLHKLSDKPSSRSTMSRMTSAGTPRPFNERFGIDVGVGETQQRFVNRAFNAVFDYALRAVRNNESAYPAGFRYAIHRYIATALGDRYVVTHAISDYVNGDFRRCLQALEVLYGILADRPLGQRVSERIAEVVRASEIDLGIDWQPPIFVRTGARSLDERLINDSLHWLREQEYETVLEPYEKGLTHYLEAQSRPNRLTDVVTDMYEAVEALAKVVTGRHNRELSANREIFVSRLGVSEYYKQLLRDYITYANQYRHAAQQDRPRTPPSEPEVESFIYLTGLFIRLAIRTT